MHASTHPLRNPVNRSRLVDGQHRVGFKAGPVCDDALLSRAASLDMGTPVARRVRKATGLRRSSPGSPRPGPPTAAHQRAACGPEDVGAAARPEGSDSCPRLSVSRTPVVRGSLSPPASPVAELSPRWRRFGCQPRHRNPLRGPRWLDSHQHRALSAKRRSRGLPGNLAHRLRAAAVVNGATHDNDAVAAQAQSDVTTAYNARPASRSPPATT